LSSGTTRIVVPTSFCRIGAQPLVDAKLPELVPAVGGREAAGVGAGRTDDQQAGPLELGGLGGARADGGEDGCRGDRGGEGMADRGFLHVCSFL